VTLHIQGASTRTLTTCATAAKQAGARLGPSGGTTTTIKEVYALGHLAEQTNGSGTILASFTYDVTGTPTSVVLGDPASGPRYDYAYDAQGNVVDVTDHSGSVVASSSYDAFGALTSSSESFPNGWSNPFRYDGAQGVRYDAETGLYWMSVRAYDPTLGRFLSHDPLGRLAAMGLDMQPYTYAGNNPVNHTDPSGMYYVSGPGLLSQQQTAVVTHNPARGGRNAKAQQSTVITSHTPLSPPTHAQIAHAKDIAREAGNYFMERAGLAAVESTAAFGLALLLRSIGADLMEQGAILLVSSIFDPAQAILGGGGNLWWASHGRVQVHDERRHNAIRSGNGASWYRRGFVLPSSTARRILDT
jgi:RHS repeat-associated protein